MLDASQLRSLAAATAIARDQLASTLSATPLISDTEREVNAAQAHLAMAAVKLRIAASYLEEEAVVGQSEGLDGIAPLPAEVIR